jgi:hypothetical protein
MAPSGEGGACAAYGGPWVRWSVIRANSLSGISQASLNESAKTEQAPVCAAVSIFSSGYEYPPNGGSEATSDVVAEQNDFGEENIFGLSHSGGLAGHYTSCYLACFPAPDLRPTPYHKLSVALALHASTSLVENSD